MINGFSKTKSDTVTSTKMIHPWRAVYDSQSIGGDYEIGNPEYYFNEYSELIDIVNVLYK